MNPGKHPGESCWRNSEKKNSKQKQQKISEEINEESPGGISKQIRVGIPEGLILNGNSGEIAKEFTWEMSEGSLESIQDEIPKKNREKSKKELGTNTGRYP